MRRIAVINQKGGVGKTTTAVNLGAALAEQGRRVVLIDLDPQANLSLSLDLVVPSDEPSTYTVLTGKHEFAEALRHTRTPNLSVCPSNIDLSGAELELAGAIGREWLLRDALGRWVEVAGEEGRPPADYVILDCPPSLGLLSVNALAAVREMLVTVQTEFLALSGMSKLVEVVELLRRRINPDLEITGIVPCLHDSRLRLAREVLAEMRRYFPGKVLRQSIRSNVKLAEAPSFGRTILEYAPESKGALDYRRLAYALIEGEDERLSYLPPPRPIESLPTGLPSHAGARDPNLSEETPAGVDPVSKGPPAAQEAGSAPVAAAPPGGASAPVFPARPEPPRPFPDAPEGGGGGDPLAVVEIEPRPPAIRPPASVAGPWSGVASPPAESAPSDRPDPAPAPPPPTAGGNSAESTQRTEREGALEEELRALDGRFGDGARPRP